MDTIQVFGNIVELAEEENPDEYHGKVVICDFNTNANGVRLSRETAEECIKSIANKPFVGKVTTAWNGEKDFTGHNVKKTDIVDADGNKSTAYEYDTSAFGSFTGAEISEYDGKECIIADFVAWKRFTAACEVLKRRVDSGELATSYELAVLEAHADEDDPDVRVIDNWSFLAQCALGASRKPAYEVSHVLEVAETVDDELASALAQDILVASSDIEIDRKEESEMKNNASVETIEEVVDDAPAIAEEAAEVQTEPDVETSSLTQWDISDKLRLAIERELGYGYIYCLFPEEHIAWVKKDIHGTKETEYVSVSYKIEGDEVIIESHEAVELVAKPLEMSEKINQMTAELDEAQKRVGELEAKCAEYRKQEDAREHARVVAEMQHAARASKLFSEDEIAGEELSEIFENLDQAKLNTLIAERLIAKESAEPAVEVAEEVKPASDLRNAVRNSAPGASVSRWLKRR